MNRVLAVRGRVVPVSPTPTVLHARLRNGQTLDGQSRIAHAGLIERGRDAQRRPRRIQAQPLAEANAWLEHYRDLWEANYQRLDEMLEELKTETSASQRSRKQQRKPKTKGKRA